MIITVTGSTRCGSTMMMRMLAAGGLPVFADNTVSMETALALQLPTVTAWLHGCEGKAVKLLEPLAFPPPSGYDYRFLLMLRDPLEQARSMRKFFNALHEEGMAIPRSAVATIARGLREDIPQMRHFLQSLGSVCDVRFEEVLRDPVQAAQHVAAYLGDCCVLDAQAMAAVVVQRPPSCLPGFLELAALPGQTR